MSYALSSGAMSMQIDAIMKEGGKNVDKVEFGVTMNIADVGKIAFAHQRMEDTKTARELVHKCPDSTGDAGDIDILPDELGDCEDTKTLHIFTQEEMNYGHTTNFLAVQMDLLGYSAHLGWLEKDTNKANTKNLSTVHVGVSGSLGDTGVDFLFQMQDVEEAKGEDRNPWYMNVSKSLGGGAKLIFAHGDDDKMKDDKKVSSMSRVVLRVDF